MSKLHTTMAFLLVLVALYSLFTMRSNASNPFYVLGRRLGGAKLTCSEARDANERSRIPYLVLHRCWMKNHPIAGYLVLFSFVSLWFYVLGNVAAECFCPSLEGISDIFRISPTLAGVTLLPFGNGAPDLFSSLASFAYEPSVGLNSVMGGGLFVTTVVVGVVSLAGIGERSVQMHCFVRDVLFYLLAVSSLMMMHFFPSGTIWHASYMLFIYAIYGVTVWWVEKRMHMHQFGEEDSSTPLLEGSSEGEIEMGEVIRDAQRGLSRLPQWEASRIAQHTVFAHDKPKARPLWGHADPQRLCIPVVATALWYIGEVIHFPRKFTVPPIQESSWNPVFASISITGAAMFLTFLWADFQSHILGVALWVVVLLLSMSASILSLFLCSKAPPRNVPARVFWISVAFVMSIVWIDLAAGELVSAMVALAKLLAVSPGVLGATLLAWGNSVGDLISNGTISKSPSTGGIQMAISGCYAGPLFNLLVGIGLSLFLTCLKRYPEHLVLPIDSRMLWLGAFVSMALLVSLVVTYINSFQITKHLGVVLLIVYGIFMVKQLLSTTII